MLETTECIGITTKGRNYTDCMEFSLLRFLHICMYDKEQITNNGFSEFSNQSGCEDNLEIMEFIKKYPKIYPDAEYYNWNSEGKKQRAEWSTFVSDRDFLDYYRNDGAELFTSVTNIIKFFNGFFNMELDEKTPELSLDMIGKKFSNQNKSVNVKIKEINTKIKSDKIKNIMRYISRPDTEYKNYIDDNEFYDVVESTTYLDIIVDGYVYYWMLYEIYFADSTLFSNKFITGHSVIQNWN